MTMNVYHAIAPRFEVKRKLYGLQYVLNTNDHISFIISPFDWEPHIKTLMTQKWGVVWDVGSNFGLFSILAARAGNTVVAFDPSNHAITHLNKSKKNHHCRNLQAVARPLTPEKAFFSCVHDASCTNVMCPSTHLKNTVESITYKEAAEAFAVPHLIKMDIEGGEQAFLENTDFLQWLTDHDISLIVELHNGYVPSIPKRFHVQHIHGDHILITPQRPVSHSESQGLRD